MSRARFKVIIIIISITMSSYVKKCCGWSGIYDTSSAISALGN